MSFTQDQTHSIDSSSLSLNAPLSTGTPGRPDGSKEGWLELPSAKGTRHGWVNHLVVLADMKLFFYAGESERNLKKPKMIIDLEKVFKKIFFNF